MGQTLHTFTVLARTHKYTQEVTDKGSVATRDEEAEFCVCVCKKKRQIADTNMVFYLSVHTGKHHLM